MKARFNRFCFGTLAVCTLGAIGSQAVHATPILMLDFGPTVVGTNGGSPNPDGRLNSPYHTVNGTFYDTGLSQQFLGTFTDTVWNQIQLSDVASGLKYSNNDAATGVALNLGVAANSTTVNLATQPGTSSALGTTIGNTGVYFGSSVGKDGIFHGTSGQNNRVGLQVTGLDAGTYDVYIAGRNTNSNLSNVSYTMYAGVGAAGSNFDFSAYASGSVTFPTTTSNRDSWIQNGNTGANYTKLTVTLSSGQALNLVVAGTAGESRGFLNAVQIVSVPEPGSFALLLVGMLGLGRLRRRASAS